MMGKHSQHDKGAVPRHVAVIMDGNGRWATQRGLPRFEGHRAGVKAVRLLIEEAVQTEGVDALTLFALSAENISRPKIEVRALLKLFETTLARELDVLMAHNIRLQFIGDVRGVSDAVADLAEDAVAKTASHTGLILTIALNYSGPWHIAHAISTLPASAWQHGAVHTADNMAVLSSALAFCPFPVDLVIRTSGEQRLSNFLLWHIGYAELYFTSCLWPDFDADAWAEALQDYQGRQRRFGCVQAWPTSQRSETTACKQ